jgi:hypothetical protein
MNSRVTRLFTLLLLLGASWLLSASPAAAQSLQLSRNADFSTADGSFSFSDVLHARITAPNINFFDIDKNEFRLKPASGNDDNDIEGSFINNLNGTYVAHIPLSGLRRATSSWNFRAEIRDHDHGEFKAEVNLTIQDGPGPGDSLFFEARLDSVGSNFIIISGTTILVDNTTTITENGLPLAFSALQKNWRVFVFARFRSDGRLFAVDLVVLERSTPGQEVEAEGPIASIQGSRVKVNDIEFVVQNTTQILNPNGLPITLADLRVGMRVNAKGLRNASGEVLATRIQVKENIIPGDEIEFTGHITAILVDSVVAHKNFITVDSTQFEVAANTEILGFDNEPISFFDLRVGELVQIKGRTRSGQVPLAERIKREDQNGEDIEIKGAIQALGDSTLTVAGLVFRVAPTTVILDNDNNFIAFAALRTGLLVEVRANFSANGSLVATRIKIEDDDLDEIEVTGFIEALTPNSLQVSGFTFQVDDSTVVLDRNNNLISFSALEIGMLVQVKGFKQFGGSLRAVRIKIEDFLQDEIEIRGLISAIGGDTLRVSGITFIVTIETEITDQNGQPISFNQLAVGMIVEVRAELRNDGWFAMRIHVEDRIDGVVELFGKIDSLRSDGFFMLGQRILVTNATLFMDEQNQPISFSALRVGDFVEVRALLLPDNVFVALRVKRETRVSDEVQLTGSISLLSFSSIIVSGITFIVDGNTVYLDHNEQPITINDLHLGMVVEVKARQLSNGALLAVRVKVEERRSLAGIITGVTSSTVTVQGLPHVLAPNSVIFDEQNHPTSAESLKVDQQVQLVAQANQSQLEILTLRIVFSGTSTTISENPSTLPQEFTLEQNYPNPFNPSTVIRFAFSQAGQARLTIYDILGRRVRTLVDGVRPAGEQLVTWNGRDEAGAVAASGIYFYRLEFNGRVQTRKLTLVR